MLLPFAAKAALPLGGSVLSGIAGKLFLKKKVFKNSILISNDSWAQVKNYNFSPKEKPRPPPPQAGKIMKKKKEQRAIVPKFEKPKHSVRFLLNERAKHRRKKKSNLMKNAKSLLTEFQGDEELSLIHI